MKQFFTSYVFSHLDKIRTAKDFVRKGNPNTLSPKPILLGQHAELQTGTATITSKKNRR